MEDDDIRKLREDIKKRFSKKEQGEKKIDFICRNCDHNKYSAFFAPTSYADLMLTPIGPAGRTKKQAWFYYCDQCTAVFLYPEKFSK